MRFIDLFAGIGGFHYALRRLGHECVFASELKDELRSLYSQNFPEMVGRTFGDITKEKLHVPEHDVLCAGFPCQPFSKSGNQAGINDTRGTLFHEIVEILADHNPRYVILENVGNFERHDNGRTWEIVQAKLSELSYSVRGTVHKRSEGHGLISPHHFGYPHTRERFFIVASKRPLPLDPFPRGTGSAVTSLGDVVEHSSALAEEDRAETALTAQQIACIEHWNVLLAELPDSVRLPSFPIWSDEFGAKYPYESQTPYSLAAESLRSYVDGAADTATHSELLELLPSYARRKQAKFPTWKCTFIRQNREWYEQIRRYLPPRWLTRLREDFPPSLRKLEWNCQGGERDLWRYVLQFRPSGLRAKRYTSIPALVAMTTTQIPILGPERRFLTRREGLRLQGFPVIHKLPKSRADAFAALGNAVHVDVVERIARWLLNEAAEPQQREQGEINFSFACPDAA